MLLVHVSCWHLMSTSEEFLHCVYLNIPLQASDLCVYLLLPWYTLDDPLRGSGLLENGCITSVDMWEEVVPPFVHLLCTGKWERGRGRYMWQIVWRTWVHETDTYTSSEFNLRHFQQQCACSTHNNTHSQTLRYKLHGQNTVLIRVNDVCAQVLYH